MKRIISVLAAAVLLVTAFAGCGEKGDKKPVVNSQGNIGDMNITGAGEDEYANYEASGKVTVAVDTARPNDYQALFDAFSESYENIELVVERFRHTTEDSAQEYLTAQAAVGKLPDIVFDEAGPMTLYITQGWVYPITEFVKDDPTFNNIPKNLIEDYTFGGELYALPLQATFGGIKINTDVLEALNVDMPELDWTPDDMLDFMKATTNAKYSAFEGIGGLDHWMAAVYGKTCTLQGYDYKTKQFNMSNSAVKALNYAASILKLPGVDASSLKNSSGGKNDYEIKFGSSKSAWEGGKIAMGGFLSGTWEINKNTEDNIVLHPFPQDASTPGRNNLHVDHCFMTTAVKKENVEAAFQVLRYLTYSTEGNLARLSMYTEENEGIYSLLNDKYYPIVTTKEVLDMFKDLPSVTDTDVYFVENIKNSYRADPWKIVPDWYKTRDAYLKEGSDNVMNGKADAASTCMSMQNKANAAMKDAWSAFEKGLATVQQEFKNTHK